jgi:hypothetical protein
MSRLLAGTIPYVSISYVGAGYAFETTGNSHDNHFVVADTDADEDDGDQFHDVRMWSFLESPCILSYTDTISGLLIKNHFPLNPSQDGDACLKQDLPLRI